MSVAQEQAFDYLNKHRLQELLDLVLNKLLKNQPEEPMTYLAEEFKNLIPPTGTATNPRPLRAFLDGYAKDGAVLKRDDTLAAIRRYAPCGLDMTDTVHEQNVQQLGDMLLSLYGDELPAFSASLSSSTCPHDAVLQLAAALACSKRLVRSMKKRFFVSLVIPMYAQQQRMATTDEDKSGEDFLRRKMSQLDWLFDTQPKLCWELVLVDDNCPHRSFEAAEKIQAESTKNKDRIRLLRVADVADITDGSSSSSSAPAFTSMAAATSECALAANYGLWLAASQPRDQAMAAQDHVLALCDPGLSTHLGQIGFALDAIVTRGHPGSYGSPADPSAVVLPPPTAYQPEPNANFKALSEAAVRTILGTVESMAAFPGLPAALADSLCRHFHKGSFGALPKGGLLALSRPTVLAASGLPCLAARELFDLEMLIKAAVIGAESGDSIAQHPVVVTRCDNEYGDFLKSNIKFLVKRTDDGLLEDYEQRVHRLLRGLATMVSAHHPLTFEGKAPWIAALLGIEELTYYTLATEADCSSALAILKAAE